MKYTKIKTKFIDVLKQVNKILLYSAILILLFLFQIELFVLQYLLIIGNEGNKDGDKIKISLTFWREKPLSVIFIVKGIMALAFDKTFVRFIKLLTLNV